MKDAEHRKNTPVYSGVLEIPKYGGRYLINKEGQVYSVAKKRLLRPTISVKGYYILTLDKKTRYLHQLLVETFIDPNYKTKKLCVDHIDRNPLNNKMDNLRLVTKSQNGINVDRAWRPCIFKRKEGGKYRVIRRAAGINKQFDTYAEALNFRLTLN